MLDMRRQPVVGLADCFWTLDKYLSSFLLPRAGLSLHDMPVSYLMALTYALPYSAISTITQ